FHVTGVQTCALPILPSGDLEPATCAECHRQYNPQIVQQFETSAMGLAGNQNPRIDLPQQQLTCADCHGTNHDTIMASRGRVPETARKSVVQGNTGAL